MAIERCDSVRSYGSLDGINAYQVHDFQIIGSVDPCVFDDRAVGKGVFPIGGVGRTIDVGVIEVEKALKMVAIGINHTAFAFRAFQFLTDDIAKLKPSVVNDSAVFASHGDAI